MDECGLPNILSWFFFDFLQDIVNAICDDDDIKTISFVGSNTVSNFTIFTLWTDISFVYLLLLWIYIQLSYAILFSIKINNLFSVLVSLIYQIRKANKKREAQLYKEGWYSTRIELIPGLGTLWG